MKHYLIHAPGWAYAGDFYGRSRADALRACRLWLGVSRMPRGYAIWEA